MRMRQTPEVMANRVWLPPSMLSSSQIVDRIDEVRADPATVADRDAFYRALAARDAEARAKQERLWASEARAEAMEQNHV